MVVARVAGDSGVRPRSSVYEAPNSDLSGGAPGEAPVGMMPAERGEAGIPLETPLDDTSGGGDNESDRSGRPESSKQFDGGVNPGMFVH